MNFEDRKKAIAKRLEPFGHGRWAAVDLLEKSGFSASVFGDSTLLETLVERVEKGEPLQYVTGLAWFDGLPFSVDPSVLIPRQETEELGFLCLNLLKKQRKMRILDIGTGSGCLPIMFQKRLFNAEIFACDVSPAALATAKKNAKKLDAAAIQFFETDILNREKWAALPDSLDLIVSNPPYILEAEKGAMGADVLAHEPHLALFAPTERPLIFYEMIAELAAEKLRAGGFLAFECSEFSARDVAQLVDNQRFMNVRLEKDIPGKERFVLGQKN